MVAIMSFHTFGGDEIALQYSDYDKIALGHAQYIDFAVKYANKVAFIDTDFVTTRAFCKKYEGREHPFVQALIDEYRFDLVILLENNTPWVADGLRSLGSSVDRKEFQNLLVEMLEENNIEFVRVEEDDYDSRFLRCVELVREMMGSKDNHLYKMLSGITDLKVYLVLHLGVQCTAREGNG